MRFEVRDEMDEFELELRKALERRPAPPGLKGKIMARRRTPRPSWIGHGRLLAACLTMAAALAGTAVWRHNVEERRKGEEARAQVMVALRITGRALNKMNSQLAHGRPE